MRSCMGYAVIVHSFLFTGCLALVGFWPMFYNLFLAIWTYSCYLCVRELYILGYAILTSLAFASEITFYFSSGKRDGSIQSIASIALMLVYVLQIYTALTYYYYYRISGGIHGYLQTDASGLQTKSQLTEGLLEAKVG